MFWDDIANVKGEIVILKNSLLRIEQHLTDAKFKHQGDPTDMGSIVRECLSEVFESEDEYSSVNRIIDKLNELLNDEKRKEEVRLATTTLDKFEDYMKNVDKLNGMINEFKGCVSLARGAIAERKQLDEEVKEMKKVAELSH